MTYLPPQKMRILCSPRLKWIWRCCTCAGDSYLLLTPDICWMCWYHRLVGSMLICKSPINASQSATCRCTALSNSDPCQVDSRRSGCRPCCMQKGTAQEMTRPYVLSKKVMEQMKRDLSVYELLVVGQYIENQCLKFS